MANCHKQYDPARDITGVANEDLVGNRWVVANGTYADGGNIPVELCDGALSIPIGVTGHDFATGKIGNVHRRGSICTVEAGGTVAAGDKVKCTTDGKAITGAATGDVVLGLCLRGGTSGALILVDTFASPAVLKIA